MRGRRAARCLGGAGSQRRGAGTRAGVAPYGWVSGSPARALGGSRLGAGVLWLLVPGRSRAGLGSVGSKEEGPPGEAGNLPALLPEGAAAATGGCRASGLGFSSGAGCPPQLHSYAAAQYAALQECPAAWPPPPPRHVHAVGFPSTPGKMTDASSFILQDDSSSATGGCYKWLARGLSHGPSLGAIPWTIPCAISCAIPCAVPWGCPLQGSQS